MNIKFTVLERMSIETLFPKEENMITLRLAKDIRNKLDLSDKEIEKMNFRAKDGKWIWDVIMAIEVNAEFVANFTETEVRFLKELVNKLNDQKKIPNSIYELCEKILDCKAEEPSYNTSENGKDKKVLKKGEIIG